MALQWIDWMDDGWFKAGTTSPYSSRKQAAQLCRFDVMDMGGGTYLVRRAGGDDHVVEVCQGRYAVLADCDCVDFVQYGAGFERACVHIWKVKLSQAIGVC